MRHSALHPDTALPPGRTLWGGGGTHWSPPGRRRNRVNARVSADAVCAQRYMLYQRFLLSQHSPAESSCSR